jgi:DNA-binding IclR family transcriptional regulator
MAFPKVLEVLQLFAGEAPRWRVERIAQRMGISSSTAYRCVAELVRMGFLEPVAGGAYVLGPAFIEFDRRMRLSDPLLRAALPRMRRIGLEIGPTATTVLSRFYRDRVIFVHIEAGRDAPPFSYERGQAITLLSPGPAARAVLTALPDRALRALYRARAQEIAAAGLGETARDFKATVRKWSASGWVSGPSTLRPDRFGIGAPVVASGAVVGSLTTSLPAPASRAEVERVGALVMHEANGIGAAMADDEAETSRLLGRRVTAPAPPGASSAVPQ